jgi:PAS domain S-box-containing protein
MPNGVLLVEDNDDDAMLIERALGRSTRLAFRLERVSTLKAALTRLSEQRFDVILADLALAEGHGLETFDSVFAKANGAAVVVLTGNDGEELGLQAVERGAEAYVVKSDRAWQTLAMSVAYASDRGRRQRAIQELTMALANAVDAIATVDDAGLCTSANAALQSLVGYTPAELVGTKLTDLVHEADLPRLASSARTASKEVDVRVIRKDGRLLPMEVSIVARTHGRGYFCFLRDMTQQRKNEGRLAAEAAITAVGSLASGLAHEINNPLAVVLANVEEAGRLAQELEPAVGGELLSDFADLRAMLGEALAASQRVQFIVRDLRAFACADDRRAHLDVNAIIDACCNLAFAEIRHRARLVRDLRAVVPVLGSEAKLAQVFLNLLVNAAHAMPEGELEPNEIVISTRQAGRGTLVVEVSDTGAGIPSASMSQIFDPFFTTKPRYPGMGLAICQATVSAHGGEITVNSREGGGTVVTVTLPTIEAEGSEEAKDPVAQRRVLVVDDDPLVLRSLTRVLARDFEVASARNGREALDLVRAGGTFDAMLCDLMMPELSGIELHELLVQDDPELAKRTVFLTGGAFSGRAQSFLDAVGQPHVEKPVDFKIVRELLLELSQTAHGDRASPVP